LLQTGQFTRFTFTRYSSILRRFWQHSSHSPATNRSVYSLYLYELIAYLLRKESGNTVPLHLPSKNRLFIKDNGIRYGRQYQYLSITFWDGSGRTVTL
jgi:hypothetical protein